MPQPLPDSGFITLVENAQNYVVTHVMPNETAPFTTVDITCTTNGATVQADNITYPAQIIAIISQNQWVWGYDAVPECAQQIAQEINIFREHPEWPWSPLFLNIFPHDAEIHQCLTGIIVYLIKYDFVVKINKNNMTYIVACKSP